MRLDPEDCSVEVSQWVNISTLRVEHRWSHATSSWLTADTRLENNGIFGGVSRGNVWIHLEEEKLSFSDGRSLPLQQNGALLSRLGDISRRYDGNGQLLGLDAPSYSIQISTVKNQTRLEAPEGSWTCEPRGNETLLTDPLGSWRVEKEKEDLLLHGPGDFLSRLERTAGRIVGWVDPRGGHTQLSRDEEGRPRKLTDPSGISWNFQWEDGALRRLFRGDGSSWTLENELRDPEGRSTEFSKGWPRHLGGWTLDWDQGHLRRMVDAVGRDLLFFRDAEQRIQEIRWCGVVWRLQRNSAGNVISLTDPSGVHFSLKWEDGRLIRLEQPDGRILEYNWDPAGRLTEMRINGHSYQFQRNSSGFLVSLHSPDGLKQSLNRDELGRWRWWTRADGSVIDLKTDEAGDLTRIGFLQLRRDAAGRPMQLVGSDESVDWYRDGNGLLAGVNAPGIRLTLRHDTAGLLTEVQSGALRFSLVRDRNGQVIAAGDWRLERDESGRIQAMIRPDGSRMTIERDLRGRVATISVGGESWSLRRDAAGRVMQIPGPNVSLGIDRDSSGLPSLLRFKGLGFVRLSQLPERVSLSGERLDGSSLPLTSWNLDILGRLSKIGSSALHYDPLGELIATEDGEEGWTADPGGISGPDNSRLNLNDAGRPIDGRLPRNGWGLGGTLHYLQGIGGRIDEIQGSSGAIRLQYDELGRLQSWKGSTGEWKIERDPFGRLVRVGGEVVEGWDQLLRWREPVAALPGVSWSTATGGTVLTPMGMPMPGLFPGPQLLDSSERLYGPGGIRLGLLQSVDPVSGATLGPGVKLPWYSPTLLANPQGDSPILSPDQASVSAWWSDGPWKTHASWDDPLLLLVEAGELPSIPLTAAHGSGLPWLDETSLPPAPFRGGPVPTFEDDKLTNWIIEQVIGEPLSPDAVAEWLLQPVLTEWPSFPGKPPLPQTRP